MWLLNTLRSPSGRIEGIFGRLDRTTLPCETSRNPGSWEFIVLKPKPLTLHCGRDSQPKVSSP